MRRRAWNLVAEAAAFGIILAERPRPFETLESFDDALTRYAASAAFVDRAHRRFEQEWLRPLDTQMPQDDGVVGWGGAMTTARVTGQLGLSDD